MPGRQCPHYLQKAFSVRRRSILNGRGSVALIHPTYREVSSRIFGKAKGWSRLLYEVILSSPSQLSSFGRRLLIQSAAVSYWIQTSLPPRFSKDSFLTDLQQRDVHVHTYSTQNYICIIYCIYVHRHMYISSTRSISSHFMYSVHACTYLYLYMYMYLLTYRPRCTWPMRCWRVPTPYMRDWYISLQPATSPMICTPTNQLFFVAEKTFIMRWRCEKTIGSPFPPRNKVSGLAQISGKVKTSALDSFGPVIGLSAIIPFLRIGCVHMLLVIHGGFFGLRLISTFFYAVCT